MDRCTAPTETDPLELCDAAATTRRVVDGVSCALCEAHAAELDAEAAVDAAIRASADAHSTATLTPSGDAERARLVDALAVVSDDSEDFNDGASEWWGTDEDGNDWMVRLTP